MAQLVSARYATALFDLALEKNEIDKINDDIALVSSVFKTDENLNKVLSSPQFDSEVKLSILKNTFGKYVGDDVMGLFTVVFSKNRESLLGEIMDVFLQKVREYKGIATAEVFSAKPLGDEKIEKITEKLSKKFNKRIEVKTIVDPSLIGGIKIRVCGHLIDGTVKKQIDDIKKSLLDIRLA
jgi:F-type H+-transporting ATPase subunit delta